MGALVVACLTMVATQLNYVVVADAHMIVALAPLAACALLYGTIPAVVTGALTGLAELIHANLLPLDYYEMYFAVPSNSVVLFALTGLLLGVLFSLVDRRFKERSLPRFALLAACCAVGSAFFTDFFRLSASVINSLIALQLPHDLVQQLTGSHEVFSQWLADVGLMVPLMFVAEFVADKIKGRENNHTIRETFQGWLAVVMAVAYMVCAALCYTGISIACRGDAERQMSTQLTYLEDQLAERDRMMEGVARRTHATQAIIDEVHRSSIGSVARQAVLGKDGITLIAEDGIIVSSNREEYVGRGFEEVVGLGFRDGFDEGLYDATRSSQWDMGGAVLGYARIAQMGYARVMRSGSYELLVAISSSEVFRYRTMLMEVVSAAFVIIFIVEYLQAALLLQNVVVRGFDKTNAMLARITDGDLEQVVDVRDTVEFSMLSGGINATVGALKDSIAEAEARIDRELKTARAIQESALPSTLRPFPEVDRFDIYASMDAAREVGGDFFDFFLVGEHQLAFLIADVSGKGIPAALFMMAAKTELSNYIGTGMELAQAVQSANYHLCQGNEAGMFVTVWVGVLDYETGELTYVNAGHNPPLLRHGGSWEWLTARGGLFLGTFATAKYRSQTVHLDEGDLLLLYTDGVTEAFSATGEQYGEDRLERYLHEHIDDHPHALALALRSDVARWARDTEQSDDITMLALEYGVAPEVRGHIVVPAEIGSLDDVYKLIHEELARRLCPIEAQNQLDIALEELFVNVCSYAYEGSDEPGKVKVDYLYNSNPDSITIQITDWGMPFDPLERKDPQTPASVMEASIGGLGIFMAKRLTDDLTYLRDEDRNIVAFKKSW